MTVPQSVPDSGPRSRTVKRRQLTDGERHDRRRGLRVERYKAQRVLWRITKQRRFAYCGRIRQDKTKPVTIKLTGQAGTSEARAGFSNLQTCGSVWSCPVCSEKVNASRQADIETLIEKWLANGGAVVFTTLTLQHHKGHSLKELWDAVGPAWTGVTGGTAWHGGKKALGDKARFGVAGWVRVVEVKDGENGWHPHLHGLMFLNEDLDDAQLEDLRGRMFGRWQSALEKQGFKTLDFDHQGHAVGVDVRRVHTGDYMAEYFAKNGYNPAGTAAAGAAYEVTGSQSKKLGKGGLTPFQLLEQIVIDDKHTIDKDAGEVVVDKTTGELLSEPDASTGGTRAPDVVRRLMRWWEWEETSRGRKQMTWSKGLRDLVGLDAEKTDEEIVEEDHGGEELSVIGNEEWSGYWCKHRDTLLAWAEDGELEDRLAAWRTKRRLLSKADFVGRQIGGKKAPEISD